MQIQWTLELYDRWSLHLGVGSSVWGLGSGGSFEGSETDVWWFAAWIVEWEVSVVPLQGKRNGSVSHGGVVLPMPRSLTAFNNHGLHALCCATAFAARVAAGPFLTRRATLVNPEP